MTYRVVALLALALLAPALTGCLGFGSDDGAEDEPLVKQRAEVSQTTGGVEGVVTDNAVQAVPDVEVRIVELERTTTTADDGSYAFSEVEPGTYTVAINTTQFVAASQQVEVRAGSVAVVDFVLAHLASDAAYTMELEMSGFMECGVEFGWDVRSSTDPVLHPVDDAVNNTTGRDPGVRGVGDFFLGLAVCFIPNVAFENTTNDRFFVAFDLDPPLRTILYAMVWESSSQMSEWMTTRMEILDFANDAAGTLFRTQALSPIEVRYDHDQLVATQDAFTENCEEGEEDYCGHSFFDEGWELQLRVFPAWQCQSEQAGVCAPFQQPFTHFVTGHFNAEAPDGASAAPS